MKVSDSQLREDLDNGLTPADIARKWGLARSTVSYRLDRLRQSTVAVVHGPQEAVRFARGTLNVVEQLRKNLAHANKILDACNEWLQHPEDPDRYHIGPRTNEVMVVYEVQVEAGEDRHGRPKFRKERRQAPLSDLIALAEDPQGDPIVSPGKGEARIADPRDLIHKAMGESRLTVAQGAQLMLQLADSQRITDFQQALLEAIRRVSPEVANAIAEEVRRSLILRGALPECVALSEERAEPA